MKDAPKLAGGIPIQSKISWAPWIAPKECFQRRRTWDGNGQGTSTAGRHLLAPQQWWDLRNLRGTSCRNQGIFREHVILRSWIWGPARADPWAPVFIIPMKGTRSWDPGRGNIGMLAPGILELMICYWLIHKDWGDWELLFWYRVSFLNYPKYVANPS